MSPGTAGPALGAVLAGGRGARLGGSKAMAELAGRPLISYPLAALDAAGLEAVVVAKPESELPPLPYRVVREPALPSHPLTGIVSALREAAGRPLVVLACDMPLAEPALLAHLGGADEELLVPAPAGELQPLQARYGAGLLPALEAALARSEPLRRTVESLRPKALADDELSRFGDPRCLFLNVNDRDDLNRAERMLERRRQHFENRRDFPVQLGSD